MNKRFIGLNTKRYIPTHYSTSNLVSEPSTLKVLKNAFLNKFLVTIDCNCRRVCYMRFYEQQLLVVLFLIEVVCCNAVE